MTRPAGFAIAALVAAAAMAAGCGKADPRAGVKGRVTLSGVPLDRGTVEFYAVGTAVPMGGALVSAGTFAMPRHHGIKPGTYRVVFHSTEQVSGPPMPDLSKSGTHFGVIELPDPTKCTFRDRIPPEFGSASTLEVTLQGGKDNVVDVAIP